MGRMGLPARRLDSGRTRRTSSSQSVQGSPSSDPLHRGLSGWRRWAFLLAAMILAPAVVLLLLEAGLRLSGYGLPSSFFVKVAGRDTLTTNRHFGKRFFPPAIARQADP